MREGKREKRKEGLAKCVILSTGLLLCAALFLAVTPGHLATFSVAKDSDGQSTEMLKIFRVQVKAPKTCCPAPGGGGCGGGCGGAAAPAGVGAPAQMDDGGTQQINMVGFTTKGMGYIQYRGWHHSWDGGHPGPVATRSYHDHKVNARYDYGAGNGMRPSGSRRAQRRHGAHRQSRNNDRRRIDALKSRLGEDDAQIESLKNEVYQLTSSVLPRIQSEVADLKRQSSAASTSSSRSRLSVSVD